jgi:hypothetical protein
MEVIMILENLNVRHKSFGDGIIIETQGNYMTVKFASCEKKFVYPDAFEKFLTLQDGTVSDEIKLDLASTQMAKQVIIDKKKEENLRAMTHGIVIPGKETGIAESEDEENRTKDVEDII